MDYKKKYEEALERAKIVNPGTNDYNIVTSIFPELKESEDERIRKSLIKSYTNQHPANFPTVDGFTREQILAWLEKQGEIMDEYEDKLDRCACESFDKGYKAALEKQGEQNPAWSEEDEKYYNSALWHIKNSSKKEGNVYNWLKSIKERIKEE